MLQRSAYGKHTAISATTSSSLSHDATEMRFSGPTRHAIHVHLIANVGCAGFRVARAVKALGADIPKDKRPTVSVSGPRCAVAAKVLGVPRIVGDKRMTNRTLLVHSPQQTLGRPQWGRSIRRW